MRDRSIVVAILVVSLVLYSFVDNWLERKNKGATKNYNGEKDDPNTDDSLPW